MQRVLGGLGTVVGALTVGKATPYLLRAFPTLGWREVVLAASAGAVASAVLVAVAYREGPYPFARRPFAWGLIGQVARNRPVRLAVYGYLAVTIATVFFPESDPQTGLLLTFAAMRPVHRAEPLVALLDLQHRVRALEPGQPTVRTTERRAASRTLLSGS